MTVNNMTKHSLEYYGLENRIFADFDNERVQDIDIVGLTQTDHVNTFSGELVCINEGDYIYMFMPIDEVLPEYIFAEGFVIKNPYRFKPYKWCCKIIGELEFNKEYGRRFNKL
ncbi:TPA: hypothetical protein N8123_004345 [Escherichia coli]|uniref:hypothetical protein n=1 Tax=Escherichia coli TaxID=562 RepID=UPI00050B8B4C|nr:hypothetical protein [Escherichia coli]EFM2071565.1 hypothetical protein [Escherichia coli]EGT2314645.1 hypothetical protein [Escherichia coli]EGT2319213.1 hypothetical protein [Escherichia coli]EHT1097507.1 hypothetical protein [Escherichia coli]EJC3553275.1 hypothetical protein [Escherichia coli]